MCPSTRRSEASGPRFSVVLPVRDRAHIVGRAVAAVLAQTFGDLELLVVDLGSSDRTLDAVDEVADDRVVVVDRAAAGQLDLSPCVAALDTASGEWATVLNADCEVDSSWLARIGRLVDSTEAHFVSCGGRQIDDRGSVTEFRPVAAGGGSLACLRAGAFATTIQRLRAAVDLIGSELDPRHGEVTTDPAGHFGRIALDLAVLDGDLVVHSPELLVSWHEPAGIDAAEPSFLTDDELRLHLAYQGIDALARTPIPDGELLARYATSGGVAAARLQQGRDARRLLRIACRARPEVRDHWTRLFAAHLGPLGQRMFTEAPGPSFG